jgi:hypothetical protein
MAKMNPLKLAQSSALAMNDDIGELFAAVGSQAHSRGYVSTAYRNARRAMKSALVEAYPQQAAREVFAGLRSNIRGGTLETFGIAQELGLDEAARQLNFYDIASTPLVTQAEREASNAALDAIIAKVDAQEAQVNALLMLNADPVQILGDEDRAGVLREADIATASTVWLASLLWDAFNRWVSGNSNGVQFGKQAVAALDGRTTDCCLRVHGQIQPLAGLFHLTGSPRFADHLDWSPFHYRCRTSIALYMPGFDDGLTADMRAGADYFLQERAKGKSPDRDPANAFG